MNRRSLLNLIGLAPLGVPALGAPVAGFGLDAMALGRTCAGFTSATTLGSSEAEALGAYAIKVRVNAGEASTSLAEPCLDGDSI